MPPIKNPKIDTEEVDPKELQKLEAAVLKGSEAPSVMQQTRDSSEWDRFRDQPGPPFDAERLTLKQMRQIRKQPMVAFGLHYRKVPIARGEWHIQARDKNGPNAQVAGFVDAALRKIFTSYILQRMLVLDFGFQSIVKQWKLENPGGVYADTLDLDENSNPNVKPVWDEGTILPKVWKPFVALRPERVHPRYVEKGPNEGDFDGIDYEVPVSAQARRGASSLGRRGRGKQNNIIEISVYNSLWATNQRWDEHGDIFGFPLTGHARDDWWDYTFVSGLQRRAFERIALPPIKARHPVGSTVVDDIGTKVRNVDISIEMAERLRSNAIAAVPSTMAEGAPGEVSNARYAWDFEYMETPTDVIEVFDRAKNYYNVMFLRDVWVPEMAFIGRESGNSGGNIAGTMQEVFIASQELLMSEVIDEITRFMIPHLLWLNFPEFVNNGGKAWIVSHGFREEDQEIYRQLIQLFGQSNPALLADIDTRELLRRANLPLRDPAELAAERKSLANQALTGPPLVPVVPGSVGTIANPNINTGFTNGGSVPQPNVVAGFSDPAQKFIYVDPRPEISLEFSDVDDFLSDLPTSKHYSDKNIRALTVQIRRLWEAHFRRLYPEFARYLDKLGTVELDDLEYGKSGMIELADRRRTTFVSKTKAEKTAKKILKDFGVSSSVLNELRERTKIAMRKVVRRAALLDIKNSGITTDLDDDAFEDFLEEQTSLLIRRTSKTFNNELRQHLIGEIQDGRTLPEIATNIAANFETRPQSKADSIARSETRDAVNAATLIAGEGASIRYVRMKDGEKFDKDCADRNGKLATIREAWRELRREHTNGTLSFELIPRANFSIEWRDELSEDRVAYFDNDSSTAYIKNGIDEEASNVFLSDLTDFLISNASNGHREMV